MASGNTRLLLSFILFVIVSNCFAANVKRETNESPVKAEDPADGFTFVDDEEVTGGFSGDGDEITSKIVTELVTQVNTDDDEDSITADGGSGDKESGDGEKNTETDKVTKDTDSMETTDPDRVKVNSTSDSVTEKSDLVTGDTSDYTETDAEVKITDSITKTNDLISSESPDEEEKTTVNSVTETVDDEVVSKTLPVDIPDPTESVSKGEVEDENTTIDNVDVELTTDDVKEITKAAETHIPSTEKVTKDNVNVTTRLPPSSNATLPNYYIPIKICGKKYYCKQGERGPCKRNEILTGHPSLLWSSVLASQRHPTCATRLLNKYGCYSPKKNYHQKPGHPSTGYCTTRFSAKPCWGYPSSYRYYRRTQRCHRCHACSKSKIWNQESLVSEPCGPDQVFSAIDDYFGDCTCRRRNHIYSDIDNKCHKPFTKGPCFKDEWLVHSGDSDRSTCRPCPCPQLADGSHVYWNGPFGRPGCYKSHTRGPCKPGMYFVVDNFMTGASRCVYKHHDSIKHDKSHRPNLYSLLMNWPLFEDDSLLLDEVDDPFESSFLDDTFSYNIDSPLMMSDPLLDDSFSSIDSPLMMSDPFNEDPFNDFEMDFMAQPDDMFYNDFHF